jgi:hypothetical protein
MHVGNVPFAAHAFSQLDPSVTRSFIVNPGAVGRESSDDSTSPPVTLRRSSCRAKSRSAKSTGTVHTDRQKRTESQGEYHYHALKDAPRKRPAYGISTMSSIWVSTAAEASAAGATAGWTAGRGATTQASQSRGSERKLWQQSGSTLQPVREHGSQTLRMPLAGGTTGWLPPHSAAVQPSQA